MDVTINERSPVDFDLDIRATHEELEPRLNAALRAQRKQMNLKGFRPGKVPLSLVRKMYGSAIAAQLAEEVIGEAYRDEVAEADGHDVLGQPRLTELDYELGQDLHAVVRFGVRPEFELADLSGVEVTRVVRSITDEDVEREVERRRRRAATLVPAEDAPVDEDSVTTLDFQLLDRASNTPIIGERHEGEEVDLTDDGLRDELRRALLGKKAGDTFQVDLPHLHGDDEGHDHEGHEHEGHLDRFRVTVQDVRHRDLPDLDEEFIEEETEGQVESVEAYRAMVRAEMEEAWGRMAGELMREEMVERLLDRHDFAVPEALVEQLLDEMEEELARRVEEELPEGKLPDDFDRAGFRAENRESAVEQVRWMLLQERLLEEAGVELTEEDYDREFERMARRGPFDAAAVKQFVVQQPQLLRNIQQRILNDRIFGALEERFRVVEKTPEELEAEEA